MVISAIGQSVESAALKGAELKLTSADTLHADELTQQTTESWIFAGGDASSGPSSVTEAVACGERAAVGIDKFLTGEAHAFWREFREVDTHFDPDADPVLAPRAPIRTIDVQKRKNNFAEVECSWSKSEALREASRCLRCDYRGNC
jgi:NADH-quinone oxidoreductase subunit F